MALITSRPWSPTAQFTLKLGAFPGCRASALLIPVFNKKKKKTCLKPLYSQEIIFRIVMIFVLQTQKYTENRHINSINAANVTVGRKPFQSLQILTTEQRSVQTEGLWQVVDVSDPLVHGSGEVVGMVQAAQDDAGEVDRLCEIAHQGALESNHIPPEGWRKKNKTNQFNSHLSAHLQTTSTILKRKFPSQGFPGRCQTQ